MSVSSAVLKSEIQAILKDADLESMSSKKVRLQLEEKLGCDLLSRKKEIDELVLACINQDEEDEDEDEDEASDGGGSDYSDEVVTKPKKRASSGGKKSASPKKKRKYESGSDDDSAADSDSGSDYKPTGPAKGSKGGKKKAKKGSDDDGSDDDYKAPKKAKKAKSAGAGKGNGFTRPQKLSPELAELMGSESLPRHEVVKKMWEIIKGRNLYDPKNKQFAICDDDVYKVIGVKRFRTFGMLKYLKTHFITE